MNGINVLTVAGTGGGKTLMYLLPAVLASKPTLVITPIKSLVNDTLQRCIDVGMTACRFTGEVPQSIRAEQLNRLGDFKNTRMFGSRGTITAGYRYDDFCGPDRTTCI